jgi:hypothetical protein
MCLKPSALTMPGAQKASLYVGCWRSEPPCRRRLRVRCVHDGVCECAIFGRMRVSGEVWGRTLAVHFVSVLSCGCRLCCHVLLCHSGACACAPVIYYCLTMRSSICIHIRTRYEMHTHTYGSTPHIMHIDYILLGTTTGPGPIHMHKTPTGYKKTHFFFACGGLRKQALCKLCVRWPHHCYIANIAL